MDRRIDGQTDEPTDGRAGVRESMNAWYSPVGALTLPNLTSSHPAIPSRQIHTHSFCLP